jgi:glutamate-1-semialdehyde aminotransferase
VAVRVIDRSRVAALMAREEARYARTHQGSRELCPRPKTAAEAAAAADDEVESLLHLYALNRGVLLTPFHNMALMCPATSADDVDRHTEVFAEAVKELTRP